MAKQPFEVLTEPYRRELRLHCYRLMGSLHEAEDLVQETLLRAWRTFDRFDGSAPRAWLYRIATNACLSALERRRVAGRLLPEHLGPATDGPLGTPADEVPWLEPIPDALLDTREHVQLAFVAALQHLPPRQRASLLLCEVLGWSAAEAARLLEVTEASVNSALQRARGALAKERPPRPEAALHPQLQRYLEAWTNHDVDAFVSLLKEEATVVMPPWREWFAGRAAVAAFFTEAWKACGGLRLTPLSANGQPGFAAYQRSNLGVFEAQAIHLLDFEGEALANVTLFVQPQLFSAFGLPRGL